MNRRMPRLHKPALEAATTAYHAWQYGKDKAITHDTVFETAKVAAVVLKGVVDSEKVQRALAELLMFHQKLVTGSCLCGWMGVVDGVRTPHPTHLAEVILKDLEGKAI